jgi:glucosamine-6-phosphate deaminase
MTSLKYVITNEELGNLVADAVEAQLVSNPSSTFIFPTGSTPLSFYKEVVNRDINFCKATTFNLDEYVINHEHPQSYHSYMKNNLFSKLSKPPVISKFPSENSPSDYDKELKKVGWADLCILGIGNNGHIAFNEPGTPSYSRTRVVDLEKDTIEANSRFFDSMDDVPKRAVTMGLYSIMKSRKIILISRGTTKLPVVELACFGNVTKALPASLLQSHKNAAFIHCYS